MATTNLESCASSPVSFLGSNYSALSIEDSVSERSVDETLSTADIPSSTSSFGISHPQLNASCPNQTECSALPQPLQASTDPGSSVNVPEKPHQSSIQTEAEFSYASSVPCLTCGADPETGVNPSQPSLRKESARGVKLMSTRPLKLGICVLISKAILCTTSMPMLHEIDLTCQCLTKLQVFHMIQI